MGATNHIAYDIDKSSERMDAILNAGSGNFADSDFIPSRTSLTYTNGYYTYITALFIDIAGSSDMTDKHKRPTIAKVYRGFISECTAIINSELICKEININGDCVWGVFNTLCKSDIDTVFSVAAKLNSMIQILNHKLYKKGYKEIAVGIGMDYGRALMVKAGYFGSGLNDVIWMGDVVNSACHLANNAGRNGREPLVVSSYIHSNLNEHNKGLLNHVFIDHSFHYEGNVIDTEMDEWYQKHCK